MWTCSTRGPRSPHTFYQGSEGRGRWAGTVLVGSRTGQGKRSFATSWGFTVQTQKWLSNEGETRFFKDINVYTLKCHKMQQTCKVCHRAVVFAFLILYFNTHCPETSMILLVLFLSGQWIIIFYFILTSHYCRRLTLKLLTSVVLTKLW